MRRLLRRLRVMRYGEAAKVLVARDGWLFLRNDTNDVVGQHTGRVRIGARDRRRWATVMSDRVALTQRLEATLVTLVAPDKLAVYPEHLPPEVVPASRRPIHDLIDVAETVGAPLVYPVEELRERARQGRPVYDQADTHWNHLGAYVAYLALCSELARHGVPLAVVGEDRVTWTPSTQAGDLGEKLSPSVHGSTILAELDRQEGKLVSDNGVRAHGRVVVFEGGAPDAPRCVLFGESYAYHMLLFLKETFSRVVYVHTSMLDEVRLEEERPEVVLSVPVERFLVRVPEDRGADRKLADTERRKLAAGLRGTQFFLEGVPRAGAELSD
jgi:hypothetical protein